MIKKYDFVVFGAGIFGLYAALILAKKDYKVAVIDCDKRPLRRASYVNQARVHNGYHYPRSFSTASKTAEYYRRFNNDFPFAINKSFQKIYAIARTGSYADAEQFLKFCMNVGIPATEINSSKYFNDSQIEAAFLSEEYSFDAEIMRKWLVEELSSYQNCEIMMSTVLDSVEASTDSYLLKFREKGRVLRTTGVVNATYAGTNQILNMFGFKPFQIKYELCEMILTNVSPQIHDVGITVMDGPFFSLMPFGKTGFHSLSAVEYTPHQSSIETLPRFDCQTHRADCSPNLLQNCNECRHQPKSAWKHMRQLTKKYLATDIEIEYKHSIFTVKTVLNSSEVDDSRPTITQSFSDKPFFLTIFSGKFNTIYDLEEVL